MTRRAAATLYTMAAAVLFGGAPGCDDGGGGPAHPSDAGGPGRDGGPPDGASDSGVMVEFSYLGADGTPIGPGRGDIIFPGFKITEMTMQLHNLELIGDTVESGDLEDASSVLDYPWSNPPRISFPSAPPGIYSQMVYRVERSWSDEDPPPGFDDQRLSIRVRGRAMVEPHERDFEYVDDPTVNFALHFTQDIGPGKLGTIVVELDLAHWFEMVDWQALADRWDEDGGDEDGDSDGDSGGDGGMDGDGGDGGPSGPGGDEDGGSGGPGNGGGPGPGHGGEIWIGLDGDQPAADALRGRFPTAFRVHQ
jgi:hypothetical protein